MMDSLEASLGPVEADIITASCTVRGEVVHRNDAWKRMLGEDDLWDYLTESDVELAEQRVQEAGLGSLVTNEVFMIQQVGRDEPVPVLLNFVPVYSPSDEDPEEEREQAYVSAVLITGEALMEPASWAGGQTKRHRLESLGRMTMGIAHDFNNLLSGILGYTELLLNQIDDPSEEKPLEKTALRQSLQTIQRAAEDGSALIEKIQEYMRQEKRTRFEAIDLPTIIQDCVALTRPYWYNEPRRQGIAIELSQDLEKVPAIMGSAVELREVIINLILNAVQAMPQGGNLSISASYEADRGVLLVVEDDGVGMSESVRQKIFEPLYTTKGEQGSGMGLAVAYGIVQEHDGTVDVASELGEGTRFTFAFPPADKHVEPPEPSGTIEEYAPARVLVVDDEEMVRSVLKRLLSLRGHTVELAASGAEGLEIANEQSFDVVFADHAMPVMNGRQFARKLRKRHPNLPIILLTGDTDVADAGKEFNEILSKPFKLDQLDTAIRQVVR